MLSVQTVEATAANHEFIFKAGTDTDAQPVPSIAGYAILLPTILSVMYGQGEWPETSVSARYGNPIAFLLLKLLLAMVEQSASLLEEEEAEDLWLLLGRKYPHQT